MQIQNVHSTTQAQAYAAPGAINGNHVGQQALMPNQGFPAPGFGNPLSMLGQVLEALSGIVQILKSVLSSISSPFGGLLGRGGVFGSGPTTTNPTSVGGDSTSVIEQAGAHVASKAILKAGDFIIGELIPGKDDAKEVASKVASESSNAGFLSSAKDMFGGFLGWVGSKLGGFFG